MSTLIAIQEYCSYIQEVLRFSPTTAISQRSVLKTFFGGMDYRYITITELDHRCKRLMTRERRPLKPSSMNNTRRILRCFYKFCIEYREDEVNLNYLLIRQIKEPIRRVKYLYPDQVEDILSKTKDPLDRLVISLLYETGARVSEVTFICVEDINFDTNEISILGKGDKERPAFVSNALLRQINRYLERNGITSGYIFRHGEVYKPRALRERVKKCFERGGYDWVTPHTLRHTFATTLYRNGADIKTIKELLGHTKIDITDRYLHFSNPELKSGKEKYLTKIAY